MAEGRGDIVFEIGGNTTSLASAGSKGVSALAAMEKAAKQTEAQIKRLERSSTEFQRAVASATGLDKVTKSARESALAFEKLAKAQDNMAGLRAQIDPLYAASMRYAEALRMVDDALEAGAISSAEHAAMTERVGKAYLTAGQEVATSGAKLGGIAGIVSNNRAAVQMFGYQIQDVAVQLAAGTRATTVFAQQGSQMLGMFGAYGALAGAALAVTVPLAGAFFSAGEGANTLKESLSGLDEAVRLVDEATKNYTAQGLEELKRKYGEIDQSVLNLIEHERQFAIARADAAATEAVAALANEYGVLAINLDAVGLAAKGPQIAIGNMAKELGLTIPQTRELVRALQDANAAKDYLGKSEALGRVSALLLQSKKSGDELTGAIVKAEASMRQLATSVPGAGWLSGMISQAETLAGSLMKALSVKAKLADEAWAKANTNTGTPIYEQGLGGTSLGLNLLPGGGKLKMWSGGGSGGGGGGGGGKGGKDQFAADLERLQQQLLSKAEIELAAYQEQQTMLEQALDKKLVTQEQYNEMMQVAQRQHQEKMRDIDVWRYGDGLEKTEAFMGAMADALQSGNEEMQRVGKIFGAAEALINALRAFNQVLADPKLPWYAKIPQAMTVLAAGMKTVQAIKGGGGAGSVGKSAAATTAATAAAPSPANVNIQWNGGMTADSLGSLTQKLNSEYKQGYRLNFVTG